jgi:hypothetical protein
VAPLSATHVILGSLAPICLPSGLVIVAQGWRNVLVVALMLDLSIAAVFIEAMMLKFLSPLLADRDITVYMLANVYSVDLPHPAVVIVSGLVQFFSGLRRRGRLKLHSYVLWILQQSFCGLSFKTWLRTLTVGSERCMDWGLSPIDFRHDSYGGATTACHLFGFSAAFGIDASTCHPPPQMLIDPSSIFGNLRPMLL